MWRWTDHRTLSLLSLCFKNETALRAQRIVAWWIVRTDGRVWIGELFDQFAAVFAAGFHGVILPLAPSPLRRLLCNRVSIPPALITAYSDYDQIVPKSAATRTAPAWTAEKLSGQLSRVQCVYVRNTRRSNNASLRMEELHSQVASYEMQLESRRPNRTSKVHRYRPWANVRMTRDQNVAVSAVFDMIHGIRCLHVQKGPNG